MTTREALDMVVPACAILSAVAGPVICYRRIKKDAMKAGFVSGWRRLELIVVLWASWFLYLVAQNWDNLASRWRADRNYAVGQIFWPGIVLPIVVAFAIRWVARVFAGEGAAKR